MSSENDWFFDQFSHDEPRNAFDRMEAGVPNKWLSLDEQGRYDTWSWYYVNSVGPEPLDYHKFCDVMDAIEKF